MPKWLKWPKWPKSPIVRELERLNSNLEALIAHLTAVNPIPVAAPPLGTDGVSYTDDAYEAAVDQISDQRGIDRESARDLLDRVLGTLKKEYPGYRAPEDVFS